MERMGHHMDTRIVPVDELPVVPNLAGRLNHSVVLEVLLSIIALGLNT